MRLVTACLISALAVTLSPQPATFTLQSPAFTHNQPFPLAHTGYGGFTSPALTWTGLPKGTRELALVCTDPDVPLEQFGVHWLLYNIPATAKGLPEGSKPADLKAGHPSPLTGASQGINAMKRPGYLPPRPFVGSGVHHYTFTLYALDADLPLAEGLTKEQLLAALKGHILGEATLVGTFERKEK